MQHLLVKLCGRYEYSYRKRKQLDLKPFRLNFLFSLLFRTKFLKGQFKTKWEVQENLCILISQMSEFEIKNTILREFSHITNFSDFVLLECESNNSLKLSMHQLNGVIAVERRGTLYLCEKR